MHVTAIGPHFNNCLHFYRQNVLNPTLKKGSQGPSITFDPFPHQLQLQPPAPS